ncbi:MAG: cell division protein FtsQ [Lutibacter sp.]|jgi:cell division protein FtsQ|nr:cell division protein FtsQ [Lutibacter sp.]MDO9594332.1 cell division protein FtsQ [Lutibacter sp.]
MKINWNYIIGILLLSLVVFLYGFSNMRNSAQKVADISIEFEQGDNLFMDYQMVNKLLIQNGGSAKNLTKSVIDLHNLEANVRSHPMVESVSVYLTVDGFLKTKIKQRTPIARVVDNNESYYIDRQAKIMPLSDNFSARVLLISGAVKEENNDEIHELVTAILNDEFLKEQIIAIEITKKNEYVLDTRVGDQKIILGKIENLDQKFKNLGAFYIKTMADSTIYKYDSINLKYNKQVVATNKVDYGKR